MEEAGADNFLTLCEMQGIYCPATIEEGSTRRRGEVDESATLASDKA